MLRTSADGYGAHAEVLPLGVRAGVPTVAEAENDAGTKQKSVNGEWYAKTLPVEVFDLLDTSRP